MHGDFIWFRDAGKTYLIQDPALLARATTAWKPMDKTAVQMSVYGSKMGELGQQQKSASKQADASMRALLQKALKSGKALAAPANAG